jgi:hypothetical protein
MRERLSDLARHRNPLSKAAEAQALIASLTAEDFRELASQPKEFPFPNSPPSPATDLYSGAFMDALVRRWLEVDPDGAVAAMQTLDEALVLKREGPTTSSMGGRRLLPEALARVRPRALAAAAEATAVAVAGADPGRTRGTMEPNGLPPGPDRDALLRGMTQISLYSQLSPERPMQHALAIDDPKLRRQTFDELMGGWVSNERHRESAAPWLNNAAVPEEWKAQWRAQLK